MKLTRKIHYASHDAVGKDRNYISYFLNDVLILKQKYPFDASYSAGSDKLTEIFDEYLYNGKLFQKRKLRYDTEVREVSFPVSKQILKSIGVDMNSKYLLKKQNNYH
jgi:hypothetical protein